MRTVMRLARRSLALAMVATTLGCATYEHVARPPSPDELARIDEAAGARGPVTVLYIQPIGACIGGGCSKGAPSARRPPVTFARLASADARTLTFESASGVRTAIPLSEVEGVAVTSGRGRAAAIGAGVLGGTVLVVTTVWLTIVTERIIRGDDGGDFCSVSSCAGPVLLIGLAGAAVGAAIGAAIGSTKVFQLDPPPAR
jgi:hypothetical protein